MTSLRNNRPAQTLALVAVLLVGATAAWAYWVAPSSGQGSGRVGSLAAPTGVGASVPTGARTVSLAWSASAPEGGPSPTGYYAERWNGATPTVVGGTCGTPGSPVATTSCTDTAVADGTYTYTVRAVYHSWSAGSAHSASVTVAGDTTPPATSLGTVPASPDGSNGWFKQSSVGFTLSASDTGSGVAETLYEVDAGERHVYSSTIPINTPGDHTVSYWSTDKAGNEETHKQAHIKIDALAPGTSLALQPSSPDGSNGWYVSTPSFTLAASDGTSGVAGSSYQLDGGTTKSYPGSAVAIPAGQHTVNYWSTDTAGNVETAHTSAQVKVDTTAPTDSLSLGGSPAHAFMSGSTLYFASVLGGSFTLLDTVGDSGSGAASATLPLLGASHWTHASQVVTTPAGGPFASSTYSWTAGAAAPSAAERTVSSADLAGNSSAGSTLTFTADSTAPTSGALTVNGTAAGAGGTTSSSTTTGFAIGSRTDYKETQSSSQSGLASSTLTVQSATLAKNSCGAPGSGGAYTSPTVITGTSNPAIATGFCYLYTLTGTDDVGNTASISTTVKVDTVAPTNSLSLGSAAHAFLNGTTLYFNSGVSGSFTLVNAVNDAETGPASATFPGMSTLKWSHNSQTVTTPSEGPYTSNTYSWSSGASTPSGSQTQFTSADAAGNTSAATTLTFVSDTTAPTGGALTVDGTAAGSGGSTVTSSTTSFTIGSRTDYTESQSASRSGLDSSVLTIQSETYSNGTCGSPGSGGAYTSATVISGTANPTIASGFCYLYTLTGTDNVGNAASVSATVKVDATAPGVPTVTLSSALGNTFVSGTTAYINPQSGRSGSFVATGSATDGESGISTIKLPSLSGFTSGGGTLSSPFETTYKWSGSVAASGAQSATATNGTGLSESNSGAFTLVADTTGPAGGSVSVPARASGTAPVTFSAGADSGSGISTSLDSITRAEATYTASSDSCGSFGSFSTLGSPSGSPYSDTSVSNGKCYEYKYVASDNVGNTATYGPTSVVKPGPKALAITAVNGTGQKKKVDAKDVITFTFSESVEPPSITSAWSTASQPDQTVTVTFKDSGEGNGTSKPDSFSVTTPGVHLGSVEMSGGSWVPTKGASYAFTSTMKFSTVEGKSVVTITLSTLQGGGSLQGEQSEDTFTWSPDAVITDLAGVAIDTSTKPASKAEHF
jgi:hypothetical protein